MVKVSRQPTFSLLAMATLASAAPALAAAEPGATNVPRTTLERYVGSYADRTGVTNVEWGGGDSLTIQLGGRQAVPLRPVSGTEFRVVGVDARVVFDAEAGRLVIHQAGRATSADRLPIVAGSTKTR